jgi:hypothetical protein
MYSKSVIRNQNGTIVQRLSQQVVFQIGVFGISMAYIFVALRKYTFKEDSRNFGETIWRGKPLERHLEQKTKIMGRCGRGLKPGRGKIVLFSTKFSERLRSAPSLLINGRR